MTDRSAEPDPFGIGLEELDAETRRLLTDHVERLCREHGLEWRPIRGVSWIASEGDRDGRWFHSPSIHTEIDYFAAVHEVGHFVLDMRNPTAPVVFEAGQHDTLDRDTAAFCAYFAS